MLLFIIYLSNLVFILVLKSINFYKVLTKNFFIINDLHIFEFIIYNFIYK